MPNENTPPPNGEIPNGTEPQPVIGKTSGTGEIPRTTTPQLTVDDALKEIERLKADLKKVHSESAGHRNKAKELDELKAKLEADKLSESEKLQKQLADAQKARDEALREKQEIQISHAVTLQASRLNFNDPDDGMRYINRADLNDDLSNVGDLLKQVLKERPYLAGKATSQQTSGGATNPSRSQSTAPQALSWEVIGKMTATEYDARRAEIQQWILNNPPKYR